MEHATTSKPHPPRRSCLICAAAKVKCIPVEDESSGGSGQCGRCRRLGKECVMQAAVPRKPRARKKTTRVAQLEQKLDGLVQLLTSKDNDQGSYPSPESLARRSTAQSPQTGAYSFITEDGGSVRRPMALEPSFLSLSCAAAEECLKLYQTKLTPNFPFVVVPNEVSAEKLRNEKPALFGAIVVATSFHSIKTQTIYGEDLLRYITDKLLIKGEKSLELIQALLVYTAWYHNIIHKKRITQLTSMLSALISDLGLARASAVNERLSVAFEERAESYGTNSQGVRTLKERRAYLGAFYISSSISATFRDLNALRRSAYLEDCCKTLERAAEFPTDRYLVSLLRLQNYVERTTHTFQYGSLELHSRHNWRVPLVLYIVPLQRDLENFRDSIEPDLQESNVLNLHYWGAMAYLFEFSLYEPLQKSYFGQPSFRRMEYLYSCLQTIKTFFNVLFTIPTSEYFHISLLNWAQVMHFIMTLSKLCFLQAEDWNLVHARAEIHLAELIEQVCSKLEEACALQDIHPASAAQDKEEDWFIVMARRLLIAKGKYERVVTTDQSLATAPGPSISPLVQTQGDELPSIDMIYQLEDEAFWQQLMGGNWSLPMQPDGENYSSPETNKLREPGVKQDEQRTGESRKAYETPYAQSTCSAAVN